MLVKEFTRLDSGSHPNDQRGAKINIVMDHVCAFAPFMMPGKPGTKPTIDAKRTVLTLTNGMVVVVDASVTSIGQMLNSYRG